jgi:hypothetical protein
MEMSLQPSSNIQTVSEDIRSFPAINNWSLAYCS